MKNFVSLSGSNAPKGNKHWENKQGIMYTVFFWVHINSDSAKREKNTVTFAICVRTIWYNREAVKFQDSGTKIKTSTTKDQFFLTLLERMVGES